MKIVFLISIYGIIFTSGAAAYVENLSKELVKYGHRITVITSKSRDLPDEERQEGIQVIRTSLFRLPFKIVKEKPDILHINIYRSVFSGLTYLLLLFLRIPSVITLHGIFPPSSTIHQVIQTIFDLTVGRVGFYKAKKVIALTVAQKKKLVEMGVKPEKIPVIPNAINLKKFQRLYNNKVVKAKYNIAEEFILYVGRFDWNKGVNNLIEAMSEVTKLFPRVKLVLVGRTRNMSRWEKIEQTVQQLRDIISKKDLEESVLFVGMLPEDDLLAMYASSAVLVLPSQYEELPTVVLEALASKTPVITTNTWGTEGIVINRETGLLVDYANSKQLADAIIFILSNMALSRKMGDNGRRLVLKNYCWPVVAKKMIELYRSIAPEDLKPDA